jgi:hypothetical protein
MRNPFFEALSIRPGSPFVSFSFICAQWPISHTLRSAESAEEDFHFGNLSLILRTSLNFRIETDISKNWPHDKKSKT